jgi:hypothetical protein
LLGQEQRRPEVLFVDRPDYGVTETVLVRLLDEVVRTRAPEKLMLITKACAGSLAADEREELRDVLADELVEEGLGPDDEPMKRGRLIEAAIDWLGYH